MKDELNKGAILIVSGPSGCGKSSLLKKLYEVVDNYYFSISTTTRTPRVGEQHGVDYFFVTKEEFESDIEAGNFLEYANVHGNYYGTSLKSVQDELELGKLVIFDIDVQGHELVRSKIGEITTSVFITTPSLKELERRLVSRATDSKEVVEKRLNNAQIEIQSIDKYDYFIINDQLEEASEELISIAKAGLCKTGLFDKKMIIEKWQN